VINFLDKYAASAANIALPEISWEGGHEWLRKIAKNTTD
jgi:hypothetical protein